MFFTLFSALKDENFQPICTEGYLGLLCTGSWVWFEKSAPQQPKVCAEGRDWAPVPAEGELEAGGHEHRFRPHKTWVQMLGPPLPHCVSVHDYFIFAGLVFSSVE